MRCMASSSEASTANKHLVTPEMVLSTTHTDLSVSPADKKLKSRVRIVRTAVLRSAEFNQGKLGANLAQWVDGNLVVTMPDVVTPEDFQTMPVSYTHLRAHETPEHLVCRLLLEKKKKNKTIHTKSMTIYQ
eukprot:TRINITY_DN11064_c0_g1_i9.p1 TRINITY_DN11064_c0_g1~~TRINITY_DN11064_c0_g1_i9.p1  ORF type:complete len:131 (-),score=47.50 TRINITY_DN11064_c0_g1_i9:23-415(-)